ncbi:hypothetical protein [Deinococcus hopiensis]|uniref:DUF2726 domain-containing protein n=1 Tax=Deinococcus hopiensis KR-140 TaxID=695939 RepID=A0A1W1UI06_9DEIO|nr:hypothetical protein [Deinococcus hopiensis]SMB80662.1 hypothetical protein SAMN00790413_05593 [Deinococcus hopiensis KR-140]
MRGLFSKRKADGKPAEDKTQASNRSQMPGTPKPASEKRSADPRASQTQVGQTRAGQTRAGQTQTDLILNTTERMARIGDRFALALREALMDQPYEVVQNVQLKDFLALTPGGGLEREARRKLDFLIVAQPERVPVLAIMLTHHTYGRDRRRSPEVNKDTGLGGGSIITVLNLDPHELVTPEAVLKVLRPHLS